MFWFDTQILKKKPAIYSPNLVDFLNRADKESGVVVCEKNV